MQPATLESGNAIPLLRTWESVRPKSATPRRDGGRRSDKHSNYFGGAHGGLIATWSTRSVSSPAVPSLGRLVTASNLNVNYVRAAAPGDHLVARSELLHLGRRTASLNVRVTKEEGKLVAHGTVTLIVLEEPPAG
jgi:acyl-CoA thioesterase